MKTIYAVTIFLAAALLLCFPVPASATEVPTFSQSHIWIDNVANPSATWSATFNGFTSLQGHAVTHSSSSRFYPIDPNSQMVSRCQAPMPTGITTIGCSTLSSPTSAVLPGEYSVNYRILEDQNGVAVEIFNQTLPITVCNGPCSPLFDFSVGSAPLRFLANTDLLSQNVYGQLDFNVDWNATNIGFSQLTDSNGNVAQGTYSFFADLPDDGSRFTLQGTFTQPGTYSFDVRVTDEFNVVHTQPMTLVVCSDQNCMQGLPSLANTGVSNFEGISLAFVFVFSGILFLVISRKQKLA